MSQPARVPRGLETLIRTLAGGASAEERDQRASTFARGLAIGALVGAAIAGSTIWQRRQTRPTTPELPPAAPAPAVAGTPATPDEPPRSVAAVERNGASDG